MHNRVERMLKIIKASAVTLIFVFVANFLLGLTTKIAGEPVGLAGALLIAEVATAVSVLALAFWGVPIHLVLKYKKYSSIFWYIILGFVPGIVTVFVFHFFGNDTLIEKMIQALALGAMGALAASVFWLFSREKNA